MVLNCSGQGHISHCKIASMDLFIFPWHFIFMYTYVIWIYCQSRWKKDLEQHTICYRKSTTIYTCLSKKQSIKDYQHTIDSHMVMIKMICRPFLKTNYNSIKYHYYQHWGATRVELGCAADEKSLEKKLSEYKKGTTLLLTKRMMSMDLWSWNVTFIIIVFRECVEISHIFKITK